MLSWQHVLSQPEVKHLCLVAYKESDVRGRLFWHLNLMSLFNKCSRWEIANSRYLAININTVNCITLIIHSAQAKELYSFAYLISVAWATYVQSDRERMCNTVQKYSKRLLKTQSPQVFRVLQNTWQRGSKGKLIAVSQWARNVHCIKGAANGGFFRFSHLPLSASKAETDGSDKKLQHHDSPKQLHLAVLIWAK